MEKSKNNIFNYIKIILGLLIIISVFSGTGDIKPSSSVEQDTSNAISLSATIIAGIILGGSLVINGYKNIRKTRIIKEK